MKRTERMRSVRFVAMGLSMLVGLAAHLVTAEETPRSSTPYRRLRESTLGYHGPSDDPAKLTEIRVGWFGPTNLDDPLTGDVWWSVNQAVGEANASPDALPVLLVPRWTADPWGSGISSLSRMVFEERPLALLGSVDSGSTHLAEQIAAKANLPLVSPLATDPSVTLAGVPWVFSCAPSDAAIARTLVNDVLAVPEGVTGQSGLRVALLAGTDHDSRMTAREVSREFARRGRSLDFRFEAPAAASDLARQRAALEAARPTAIVVVAGPEDAARWVLALRSAVDEATGGDGNDRRTWVDRPLLFGSHTMGRTRFRRLAGPAAEGVRFPVLFAPRPPEADPPRFVEAFTRLRGHAPDYAATLAYDATRLLVDAARRAGPNRARLREALVRLTPWSGLAGPIDFDGTGQNRRATLGMGTIRNGELVLLANPDVSVRPTPPH